MDDKQWWEQLWEEHSGWSLEWQRWMQDRFPEQPLFELGRVHVTRAARETLTVGEIFVVLHRHSRGDWGEGPYHTTHEWFVEYGMRLDSHYQVRGRDVLVTTEPTSRLRPRRDFTTVFLFAEYHRVHGLE